MEKRYFISVVIFICLCVVGFGYGIEAEKSVCTDDIFMQIYPNQNECLLTKEIPEELSKLAFVELPINEKYNTNRFNYNKRFNVFPHAIIIPETPEDVAAALKILRKYNLRFSVRSGGHCYEPGSLSSGYIIDLRNFNAIKPDLENEEVYIGAGCRLGPVIETLGKLDYAIPTGTCQSVGITGLALGGGIGFLARTFGLTCDSIKSITLLNASSEIIEVNQENYPDLFWALRGGGNGSFGIVLGFTFKMYNVPKVRLFELEWDWDPKLVPKVIDAWQKWVVKLPETITTQLQMWYYKGESHIVITGIKVGPDNFTEWEDAFGELKPRLNVYAESYLDSAKRWTGTSTMPFFKAKSKIIIEPLSTDASKVVVNYFEGLKKSQKPFYTYFEIGAFGGKLRKGDSAFYPRHALAWWHQIIYWNEQAEEAEAVPLLNRFYRDISKYVSRFSYPNSVDYDLGDDYLEAYYGDHVKRLIEVKSKYDPQNVFNWRQSIPVAR